MTKPRKVITIQTADRFEEITTAESICEQLKGNAYFENDLITVSISDSRYDGTKNEVHIYVDEKVPSIKEQLPIIMLLL